MENKCQESFKDILIDISKVDFITYPDDDENKKIFLKRLENYYEYYGRHFYSDISMCLYKMSPQDIDYMVPNLLKLIDYSENIKLNKKIFKLIDHIKLETHRINKISKDIKDESIEMFNYSYQKFKEEYGNIKKYTDDNMDKAKEKLEKLEKSINNFNMESITILGIFSGIVMAFFGGLGFLNGILENMHKVSKYRLIFITLIIGFILFNVFYFFMYCIGKLVDKPIQNKCIADSCNKCKFKCCLMVKVKRRYPFLFWINLFLIIMTILVLFFWLLNKFNIISI